MRYTAFGRRKLDRVVHVLAIVAFSLNFLFVLVGGYFIGRFVKLVDALNFQVGLIRGLSKELEDRRDRCQEVGLKSELFMRRL